MLRRLLFLISALAVSILGGIAYGQGAPAHRMENRFLFVIETSSSMASRTNAIDQVMSRLLESNLHGELRNGDTIGIWTYNERLHTEFPMQVWSNSLDQAIGRRVENYLHHLHYEKHGRLEKVFPAVRQVLENSERLTVFFLYDGTERLTGTPFDDDINDLQKRYAREFRSSHLPMVTVLAAEGGRMFDYSVNYPDSITIPHTADPLPPPVLTNAPLVAPIPAPRPARHIEIIMSGRTNAPETPPPTLEMVTPKPVAPAAPVVVTNAPQAAPVAKEEPASAPATNPAAAPAASVPEPVIPEPVPTLKPTNAPAPVTAPVAMPTPIPVPAGVPPSRTEEIELGVIAVSLFIIAVVLVIFLFRRHRGDGRQGAMSQSMDRPR